MVWIEGKLIKLIKIKAFSAFTVQPTKFYELYKYWCRQRVATYYDLLYSYMYHLHAQEIEIDPRGTPT